MIAIATPAVSPSRAVARTPDARAAAVPAAGGFAALVAAGDVQAGDDPLLSPALGDLPAPGRQDDAATGNASPAEEPALSSTADASWLAAILAGSIPGTVPVEPVPPSAAAAAPPVASPSIAAPAPAPASGSPAAAATAPAPVTGLAAASSAAVAPDTAAAVATQASLGFPPASLGANGPSKTTTVPASPAPAVGIASNSVVAQKATAVPAAPANTRIAEQPPVTTTSTQPAPLSVTSQSVLSGTVAPAGEVFAAAIRAAGRQSDDPRDGTGAAMAPLSLVDATGAIAGVVTAAGDRGGASLDMRHDGWPSAIIDHIEKLRDAADATDTRIRVVPDALGSIDVSLSRHDSGVHVTLLADQAATQAMLADARPQLVALAEARGLRLTDAGVSGGGGDSATANGQRQSPAAVVPTAPPSASAITDDTDTADGRVA